MTRTQARADRGESISAAASLTCQHCGLHIGATKLHHMIGNSIEVWCSDCIGRPSLHARYFPGCTNPNHVDAFDHPTKLQTRTRNAATTFIRERTTTR